MGVPAFFRWLSMKYPSIVVHCVEKRRFKDDDDDPDDSGCADPSDPYVNGTYDNFYLDMNAIIHPCTHPENKAAPKNEDEMFVAIFEYIDRLMKLIRPKRLLYMAVDGVAPRAKMNQQRSRRFRAGKESKEKMMTIKRLRAELEARNAYLPPAKPESEHFDSNCITPGTPFMARLATALRYYIYSRLTYDPLWSDLIVLLSDANVPGEGEHKIMDFIRRQRSQPDHNPNTRHCLFGADADLIMLGLATHEPYFTIVREEFKPNQPKPCDLCGQFGHEMEDCVGAPKLDNPEVQQSLDDVGGGGTPPMPAAETDFILIRLDILRQYLAQDLQLTGIAFTWDLERVIDDWVFICFFVGNDFLPHLPCLEIRENAIDRLIEIYKSVVQKTESWLTDSGKVRLDKVQLMMVELGKMENDIFRERRQSELDFRERKRNRGGGSSGNRFNRTPSWRGRDVPSNELFQPMPLGRSGYGVAHNQSGATDRPSVSANQFRDTRRQQQRVTQSNVNWVDRNLNNLEAATAMRAMLRRPAAPPDPSDHVSPSKMRKFDDHKTNADQMDEDEAADARDEVRLWEDGWRTRYYHSKFGVDPEDAPEFCSQVAKHYAVGLCWVLAYYYQGCASWDWYFPYHYAPFAGDFANMDTINPDFASQTTKPFKPLEQLMGVFPADSRSHVPPAWRDLMTDPDSPVIDFYPTDFKIDLNGKRFLWMGVALLPFVNEQRLLPALEARRHLLSAEEVDRNIRGPDRLFCRSTHPLCGSLHLLYESGSKSNDDQVILDPRLTNGMAGRVWRDLPSIACLPGSHIESPAADSTNASLLPAVKPCQAISVQFADLQYPSGFIFPAKLLEKVNLPPPVTLRPPERGRGRGGGPRRGSSFNRSSSGSDSSFNNSPMDRMIRGSLSNSRGSYNSSNHQPDARYQPRPINNSYDDRQSQFDRRYGNNNSSYNYTTGSGSYYNNNSDRRNYNNDYNYSSSYSGSHHRGSGGSSYQRNNSSQWPNASNNESGYRNHQQTTSGYQHYHQQGSSSYHHQQRDMNRPYSRGGRGRPRFY